MAWLGSLNSIRQLTEQDSHVITLKNSYKEMAVFGEI